MKCLKPVAQFLMLFTVLGCVSVSFAHQQEFIENGALPSCETVANDADGDGYGWVPHVTGAHSCIVDQSTTPKPLFAMVGDEKRPLNMIRTYWDPNVDFANKDIECTIYRDYDDTFNDLTDEFTIRHYPLPDVKPFKGEFEISFNRFGSVQKHYNVWRAADGAYFGEVHYYNPAQHNFVGLFADYWGELIDIDGQQGMRFWYGGHLNNDPEVINGNLYQECKYSSGAPFIPTGSFNRSATQSGLVEFPVPGLSAGPPENEKPEIIHRVTNAMVDLQSFSWNIEDDLLFKKILCLGRNWNGYYFDTYDSSRLKSYTFMPPLPGETTGHLFYMGRHGGAHEMTFTYFWSVVDGKLQATTQNPNQTTGFPVNGGWYETIVGGESSVVPEDSRDGVRVWHHNTAFDTCWLETEHARSGEVLRPSGAAAGSVEPNSGSSGNNLGQSIGCDYSNAGLYGGWGWNAATSQSCAPLENVGNTQSTAQCIDADGDGYGWDGVATCLVDAGNTVTNAGTDSNCDYSDANLFGGWGWNAVTSQSCAPLENVSNTQPTAQCIDTDGDGWGWDGTASCIP